MSFGGAPFGQAPFGGAVGSPAAVTRAAADTLGTTDAANRAATVRARAASDSLGTSDVAGRAALVSRAASDSLGTTDSAALIQRRVILRPDGTVTAGWQLQGGAASTHAALNGTAIQPAAGETTQFVNASAAGVVAEISLSGLTLAAGEIISGVTAWEYGSAGAVAGSHTFQLYTGTTPLGTATTVPDSGAQQWRSQTYSGPLSQAQSDDLRIRFTEGAGGVGTNNAFEAYVEVTVVMVPSRSTADSLGTTDVANRSAQSFARAATDVLGTTDAVARAAQVRTRAATDSLGTSDVASRAPVVRSRSATDSLGTSDSVARAAQVRTRAAADSLGTTDAAAHTALALSRAAADSLGTTDVASRAARTLSRAASDSLGTTDVASIPSSPFFRVGFGNTTSGGTSIAVTIPLSAQVGDVALFVISAEGLTFATPSGCAKLDSHLPAGSSNRGTIFKKKLISGDPGSTITFVGTGSSNPIVASCAAFGGAEDVGAAAIFSDHVINPGLDGGATPRIGAVAAGPRDLIVTFGVTKTYLSTGVNDAKLISAGAGYSIRDNRSAQANALQLAYGAWIADGPRSLEMVDPLPSTSQVWNVAGALTLSPTATRPTQKLPSSLIDVALHGYGTSFLAYVVPPGNNPWYSKALWYDRIARQMGAPVEDNDLGMAGAYAQEICGFAYGTVSYWTRAVATGINAVQQPGTWMGMVNRTGLVLLDLFGNDALNYRRTDNGATQAKALASAANTADALVRLLRASSYVHDDDASLTYAGTWAAATTANDCGGGKYRQTTTPGSTVSFTTSQTDIDLVLLGIDDANAGAAGSAYEVRVGGALVASGSLSNQCKMSAGTPGVGGTYNNSPYCQMCVPLRGLAAGSKAIEVKHVGAGGQLLRFDGYLIADTNPNLRIVINRLAHYDAALFTALGYGGSNADLDAFSAIADTVAAAHSDGKVLVFDPLNSPNGRTWDYATMANTTDLIHFTDPGAAFMASGIIARINAADAARAASDTLGTTDSAARVGTAGRAASDSLGTTDSAARATTVRARAATDSLSTSDVAGRVFTSPRSATDALGTSDAANRGVRLLLRAAADALATTDAVSGTAIRVRASADSLGTVDAANRAALLRLRAVSDLLGTSDVAQRAARLLLRAAADSLGTSDAAQRAMGPMPRAASDALGTSDAAGRAAVLLLRAATDSLGTSDAAQRAALSFARAAADVLATTDAAGRSVSFTRAATDTLGTTDLAARAARLLARAAADALGTTDAAARTAMSAAAATDVLGTTDQASRAARLLLRAASDLLGTSDAAGRSFSFVRAANDLLGTADAANRAPVTWARSAGDVLATSDSAAVGAASVMRAASDLLGTVDAAARSPRSATRAADDLLGTSDSTSRAPFAFRAAADSLGTSDAAQPGSVVRRAAQDLLATTDTANRSVQAFVRAALDALGTFDAAARVSSRLRAAQDALGTSDAARGALRVSRGATDVLGTTDTVGRSTFVHGAAQDVLLTTDTVARNTTFFRAAQDILGTRDRTQAAQKHEWPELHGHGIFAEPITGRVVSSIAGTIRV